MLRCIKLYVKLLKGGFMENKIELKDKIIMQSMFTFMYVVGEWIANTLLSSVEEGFDWEIQSKKIIIMLGVNCFAVFLFTVIKRLDNRISFAIFNGIESIIVSLFILYEIFIRYDELYGKRGFEFGFIYAIVGLALFLGYKDFYKKLPSEKELEGKKKKEPQKGLAYASAACVISVLRLLTIQQKYIVNMLVALAISCGWLVLGWYMFQAKKKYLDHLAGNVD